MLFICEKPRHFFQKPLRNGAVINCHSSLSDQVRNEGQIKGLIVVEQGKPAHARIRFCHDEIVSWSRDAITSLLLIFAQPPHDVRCLEPLIIRNSALVKLKGRPDVWIGAVLNEIDG